MVVEVLVWKPFVIGKDYKKRYCTSREAKSSGGNIGHAALRFDDNGTEGYVSWVPFGSVRHDPSLLKFKALYTSTAAHNPNQSFAMDVDMESGAVQDLKVPLSKDGYGLSDAAIARWWKVFNASGLWRTRAENCSTVVATAMRMGGADIFCRAPMHFYWDPMDVYDYAISVMKEINRRWMRFGKAMEQIKEDHALYPGSPSEDHGKLWTSAEFKKESYVSAFSRRYALLTRIDNLLDEYHRLEEVKLPERDTDRQVKVLEEILITIHEQSMARPKSKRKKALFTLGEQALRHHKQLLNKREDFIDVDSPIIGQHVNHSRDPNERPCPMHPQYLMLECPMC